MHRETGVSNGGHDGPGKSGTDSETDSVAVDVFQLYRGNRREEERAADADDVRFEVRHDDRDELTYAEFNRLYEHVGRETISLEAIDTEDGSQPSVSSVLNAVWMGWNRGSGRESQAFVDAKTRSLEVADLIAVDGSLYLVAPIGWREADLGQPGPSGVA